MQERWKTSGASLYLVLLGATADIAAMYGGLSGIPEGVWELM